MSGASSPLSSSSTLIDPISEPPSPKAQKPPNTRTLALPLTAAGTTLAGPVACTIEALAARHSGTVVVFDTAEQVGFGSCIAQWITTGSNVKLVRAQTRAGAGLALAGRLSEGTSTCDTSGVITAFTTPEGLAQMIPALSTLPSPSPAGRLVIQVAAVTPTPTLELTSTLAPAARALASLGPDFIVLVSSTAQEAADFAALSYSLSSHVVHVFDHAGAARETGASTFPEVSRSTSSFDDVTESIGFDSFTYTGDSGAEVALALLNGPLAALARLLAAHTPGLGVLSVRALRPWDAEALRKHLPASVKKIHVVEELPDRSGPGPLFGDILTTRLAGVSTLGHRVHSKQSELFHNSIDAFADFVTKITSLFPTLGKTAKFQSLAFLSTPASSSLADLPQVTTHAFLTQEGPITARLLSTYDGFASSGGVKVSRIVLSSSHDTYLSSAPVTSIASLEQQIDHLIVADPSLLSSINICNLVKEGAPVLVFAGEVTEVASYLPRTVVEDIHSRGIRLYAFDVEKAVAEIGGDTSDKSLLRTTLAHITSLRIYLDHAATPAAMHIVASNLYGDLVAGVLVAAICDVVWRSLVCVEIPTVDQLTESAPTSRKLTALAFNVFSLNDPSFDGRPTSNIPMLDSWAEAAKRLMFREAFFPAPSTADTHSADSSLRPDITQKRFLITCTVNKRLTPPNYDRNVFHLEFDTAGTGLKYAIGEALSVYAWNAEADVLEFCKWYGIDSNSVLALPVPGRPDQMHTRTALQILQQQVNLFGRPRKRFYAALAEHAKAREDAMTLRFIAAPEGSTTLKRLSERDAVTFADVLCRFPSARPSLFELAKLVGDIKPRHYSISSAQSVVGDRVDLLIGAVSWVTPDGRLIAHCSLVWALLISY